MADKKDNLPSAVPPPGFGRAFALAAFLGILCFLLGRYWLFGLRSGGVGLVLLDLAATVLLPAFLLWKTGLWRRLYAWLVSPRFAVAVLVLLLAATVLGTFVVQGLSSGQFAERYGKVLGTVLRMLFLRDVFHSEPFQGLLGLLAVCLVLVIVRRRAWRPREWGFLLSHGGIVVVLIGGLVFSLYGGRWSLGLREGESAGGIAASAESPAGRALPFALRLDDFEVEEYLPRYRFSVYEAEEGEFRPAGRYSLEDAEEWTPLEVVPVQFRLVKVYPDFRVDTELREAAEGKGRPALRLRAGGRVFALFAGEDAAPLEEGGPIVRFVWDAAGWEPPVKEAVPERHVVVFRKDERSEPEEKEVRPGETYPFGDGYEVVLHAYYPDFLYDTVRRVASTRSDEPKNPALHVTLRRTGGGLSDDRYLVSAAPGFGRMHGRGESGPSLAYRYEPAREPPEREIVVAGRDREVREYRRGRPVERRALTARAGEPLCDDHPILLERLMENAEGVPVPVSVSGDWRRPVAEVELRSEGETVRRFIGAGMRDSLPLGGGRVRLVFDRGGDEVRAYRSRVSVLEGGREAVRRTIEVNRPLVYKGYRIYQSDWRRDDPTYSGFTVVRNPGLGVVYAGFAVLCIGMVFAFYVRPRRGGS